ncbi:hypothetical protein GF312_12205 [Candidatus Poribacteria bacterium]|nr:hypothetical protein [Candidatus Poribacteria bacterium]
MKKTCFILMISFGLLAIPYFAAALNTDGLVLYMDFEDIQGTTVMDLSGTGNHGTLMGNAKVVDGYNGSGLELIEIGDFVEVADSDSLDVETGLTLAIWANVMDLPDDSCALFMKPTAYMLHTTTGDDGVKVDPLIFVDGDYGGWPTPVMVTAPMGEWHHFAATYDDGVYAIYVDGEYVDGYDRVVSGNIDVDDNPLAIGRDNRDCCSERTSPSLIDDAMVWSRALTEAEVKEIVAGSFTAVDAADKLSTCWGNIKVK